MSLLEIVLFRYCTAITVWREAVPRADNLDDKKTERKEFIEDSWESCLGLDRENVP